MTRNFNLTSAVQVPVGRVRLLASVASSQEAAIAVAAGADIVDAKDPRRGALGALDTATLTQIRATVPRTVPLSATTGDIPAEATDCIVEEMERIATAGVDIVKIGFFGNDGVPRLIEELSKRGDDRHAFGRRVGVLLADRPLSLDVIADLPAAGFSGVMLDTAEKSAGSLLDIVSRTKLEAFLARARSVGLFAGLAGALRLRHIPEVRVLSPDVAGFRGALCRAKDRLASIDADAIREVRAALRAGTAETTADVARLPE